MTTQISDSMSSPVETSAHAWHGHAPAATTATPRRDTRVLAALSDLIHSYPRPAYMADDRGEVIAMNAAAGRLLDDQGEGSEGLPPTTTMMQIEGHTYHLYVPPSEADQDELAQEGQLPPRLARIARLVVSGCTDKQIAARTGLSFSTVRTYVRQIYRRVGVHNRVELVHRTNAGAMIR
jgi:DNA-binding CsgD family transcriptional regulator